MFDLFLGLLMNMLDLVLDVWICLGLVCFLIAAACLCMGCY